MGGNMKTIADCAAQIMSDGAILSYRAPLAIVIYNFYMVCNGINEHCGDARKQKAVVSALGKDPRFESIFMPGCTRPFFILKGCNVKNLIYN